MLGARCLASRCLRLATGLPEICHRRSRRHPAFAPAGFAFVLPACAFQSYAAAPSLPPRLSFLYLPPVVTAGGFRRSATSAFGPGSRPVRCHRVAPILELSRLAFGRSLLHAVSRSARGQMSPPSSGSNLRKLQGLAAFRSRSFVSRRQVESAPESAI